MEQYSVERYLARIGYVSGSEQQNTEPDIALSSDIRLANIEKVQAKILNILKAQFAAQQRPFTTIPSRPAAQTRSPDLHEEPPSPPTHPNAPSTTSTPRRETKYRPFEPRRGPKSRPPPPPPLLPTTAEKLAGLCSELERRQKVCSRLERQIEACRKQIRAHPPQRKKIEKEHEKRIARAVTPVHNHKQRNAEVEERGVARTAEEADFEGTRNTHPQRYREPSAVPTAEPVDARFATTATTTTTRRRLKNADGANQVARKRGAKLEGKLPGAECAVFATEEEGGAMRHEAGGLGGGESGMGGRGEGKRRSKRRGGVGGGKGGSGAGGDGRVGGWEEGGGGGGTLLSSKTGGMGFGYCF